MLGGIVGGAAGKPVGGGKEDVLGVILYKGVGYGGGVIVG